MGTSTLFLYLHKIIRTSSIHLSCIRYNQSRMRSLTLMSCVQAMEDKEHAENDIREYENAMDELENSLKDEMAKKDCESIPC
jgi:hypothetical protein